MGIVLVVPTIGRPTLIDTISSAVNQMHDDDRIMVMGDGLSEGLQQTYNIFRNDMRMYWDYTNKTRDSGNSQRDAAIGRIPSIRSSDLTHIAFCDDDDVLTPTAFDSFRRAIKVDPSSIWMFKMRYGNRSATPGLVLWKEPKFELCNVGTPMWLVPWWSGLPKWRTTKDLAYSDYYWLDKVIHTCYDSPDVIRWDSDEVCLVRPSKEEVDEILSRK